MTACYRLWGMLVGAAWMGCAWGAAPAVDIDNSPQLIKACSTVTGSVLSGSVLAPDGIFGYAGGFDAGGLNGRLRKFLLSKDGNGLPDISAVYQWDAAEILTGVAGNAPKPSPQERNIFIGKSSGNSWATVKFSWDVLSDVQKAFLNGASASKEATGLQRLEYLRGVRDLEVGKSGGVLRKREGLLGDIVNSTPVYVGEPSSNMQGSDYQAFHARYKNRRRVVYIGANDGMLHAFSADDGVELFAYVPNILLPGLPQLTRTDYQHRPYADGRLAVAEARVAGSWRTVLAAAMGGGAQGIVALDVTDPDDFSGGKGAIWEFGDSDDPDMGNITGMPLIARFKVGSVKGIPQHKYFVAVANGVNSYRPDGSGRFGSETASVLFLLSLDKAASEKWQSGVNYFKFKMPHMDASMPGGLMSPVAVTGDEGVVKFIYAGDLQGNLWRFDFADGMPKQNAGSSMAPLFVAMDDKQRRQPISSQPRVVFAPAGGYVVLFGTGKFLEKSDVAAAGFSTQSFYAILDTAKKDHRVNGRGELAQRVMNKLPNDAFQVSGTPFSYGVAEPSRKGWYVDFPESDLTGERSIGDLALASGKVFFNSLLPGGVCANAGGRAYALDALTGLSPNMGANGGRSTAGLASPPILLNVGLQTGARNAVGKGSATKKYVVVNVGNGRPDDTGGVSASPVSEIHDIAVPALRFSWREVINWPELHAAALKKQGVK